MVTGPPAAAHAIPASEPGRRLERNGPRRARAELGLDLGDDDPPLCVRNLDRVVDRRRGVVEHEVDHRAANRDHPALELAAAEPSNDSRIP